MVRRSRGRGARVRGARTIRAQLRVDYDGVAPRGRNDPPRIVANPWNSIVLIARGLTTGKLQEVTPSSLRTLLVSQAGLDGLTAQLDFRFLRVDVWLDPITTVSGGAGTSNLGLLPTAWQATSLSARTWIEDVGTSVRHAHCHYIWPRIDQNSIVNSSYNLRVFAIDTKVADLGFTQHVHLLWRSRTADLVPSFRLGEPFESLSIDDSS